VASGIIKTPRHLIENLVAFLNYSFIIIHYFLFKRYKIDSLN